MSEPTAPQTINVGLKIENSVVLPAWLAGLAIVIFLCALLSILVILVVAGPELAKLGREVRVLALEIQDIENVLIRADLAHRNDFAHPPKEEKDVRPAQR